MSAFFVGTSHVDALLSYLKTRGGYHDATLTELGQTLLRANVAGLKERYPSGDWSGTEDLASGYAFKNIGTKLAKLGPLDILSMCDCYDYQCSEADDYPASEAFVIIEDIRHVVIKHLLENKQTVWVYEG
jgi:hypothetical protein